MTELERRVERLEEQTRAKEGRLVVVWLKDDDGVPLDRESAEAEAKVEAARAKAGPDDTLLIVTYEKHPEKYPA